MERKHIHRFCHDAIPGANWRPTRFAATVPSSYVCSVCGMIPMWSVQLPCSHVLCRACHAVSSENGAGLCPLDRQPFEKVDSVDISFPDSEVRSFQVYCWNEAEGCEFVGPMETLLWHYEHECTFHVVECLRCTEAVLHKDLVKHYENGCGAASSPSDEESSSSQSAAGTPGDTSVALEEPMMLLQDLRSGLPAITTLLNEVVERAKHHEVWFSSFTSDFRASMLKLKRDMAQMSNVVSPTPSRGRRSRRSSAANADRASLSPESENALVLRKLEHFAHMSIDQLELVRRIVTQPAGHRSVIVDCEPIVYNLERFRRLSDALSSEHGLSEEIARQKYTLCFKNAEDIFLCTMGSKKLADVTMPFTRDTYFTIVVWKRAPSGYRHARPDIGSLDLDIEFNGLLEDSRCVLSDWIVRIRHPKDADLHLEGPPRKRLRLYASCGKI
ncbi:hypothetical protein MTO96_018145 [Rhipicephalus appendiculatus]